jgi:hypothetical protein
MSEGREGDDIYWHIVTFSPSDNFTTTSGANLVLVFSENLPVLRPLPPVGVTIRDAILVFNVLWLEGH